MTAACVSPDFPSPPSLSLTETAPTWKATTVAPKAPAARGFTLAEQRSIAFEKLTLYLVLFVAVVAAVVSFVALAWVGQQFMDYRVAFLLPLAIDGFAIACSVGIVRSQASGERARQRASEWLGMFIALGLSVGGNVFHGLHTVTDAIPRELVIAYSAAVPIIVAYGIHVYGRAMSRGISAHVLADEPDKLHFDVVHLGEETVAQKAAPARIAKTPAPARPATAAGAVAEARTTAPRPAAPASAPKAVTSDDEVFARYAASVRAGQAWTGKQVGDALGFSEGAGRTIRARWDKRLDALNAIVPPTDRGAADLDAARSTPERASA